MSEMQFPPLDSFPERDGLIPNCTISGECFQGAGILVSQNGSNYHRINVDIFLRSDPNSAFVRCQTDAQGARDIADHLYMLAQAAEKGEPSS